MSEDLNYLNIDILNIIEEHFTPQINAEINSIKGIIQRYKSLVLEYQKSVEKYDAKEIEGILSSALNYHQKLSNLISALPEKREVNTNFDKEYSAFITNLDKYLNTQYDVVNVIQTEERFSPQKDDRFNIRFLKRFKNVFYSVSQFPVGFKNSFLRIFKKN